MAMRPTPRFWTLVGVVVALASAVTFSVVMLSTTENREAPALPDPPVWTRLQTDPIQCRGSIWEQAWAENHPEDPYSPDLRTPLLEYYESEGVHIRGVEIEWWEWEGAAVCDACFCAAGYTLYVSVWDSDVDRMLEDGFTVV